MTEREGLTGWSDIRERRREMFQRIMSKLTEDERKVVAKVLELNIEGRALTSPRVRRPLFDYVTEVIK